MHRILPTLIISAACVAAQSASGPVLGWSVDKQAGTVRTIYGVPGASHQGDAQPLPDDLRARQLSPASSLLLALTADSGAPVLIDLADGARTLLDAARTGPSSAAWSPSGTALALLYKDTSWIQIFALKDGAWKLAAEFESNAARVAVSDDGTAALLAQPDGLVRWDNAGISTLTRDAIVDFTFLAGSTTPAYQAARALQVGDISLPIAPAEGETIYLGAVRGGRLSVAHSTGGRVITLDALGQTVSETSCGCAVTGFDALGRGDTLRLITDSGELLWLAEASVEPKIYFVPAPAEGARQ